MREAAMSFEGIAVPAKELSEEEKRARLDALHRDASRQARREAMADTIVAMIFGGGRRLLAAGIAFVGVMYGLQMLDSPPEHMSAAGIPFALLVIAGWVWRGRNH
jgi:hypothetical protein